MRKLRTGAKSVGTRAHDAVMEVLVAARIEARLTQRDIADRLPAWLGWMYTTVAKAEKGRRSVSFVEVREYARIVNLDVATVDERATNLAAGRRGPVGKSRKGEKDGGAPKSRAPRKKR